MDELITLASHHLESVTGGTRTSKPPGPGNGAGASEAPTPLPSPLPQLAPAPPPLQIGQIAQTRAS